MKGNCLETFCLAIILVCLVGIVTAAALNWVDSLPPSPAERAGLVQGPKR